jgi:hypothetical protein
MSQESRLYRDGDRNNGHNHHRYGDEHRYNRNQEPVHLEPREEESMYDNWSNSPNNGRYATPIDEDAVLRWLRSWLLTSLFDHLVTTASTVGTTLEFISRSLLKRLDLPSHVMTRVAGTVEPKLRRPYAEPRRSSRAEAAAVAPMDVKPKLRRPYAEPRRSPRAEVAAAAAMDVKPKLRRPYAEPRRSPRAEVAAAAAMEVKPRLVIPIINSTKTSGVAAAAATHAGTKPSQGPVPPRPARLHPSA